MVASLYIFNSNAIAFMLKSYINNLKGNPFKNFLMKLFVLFITVVLLDFSIGSLLKIFYFRQQSGLLFRTTYSIEKTTADILIFGSSTATHNYHPKLFENRLNMSVYNVGSDGVPIFYHYAVLKAVLKRYTPKIVICDFDVHEFSREQESYDRLSCLLPYYQSHPEIRSIVDLKSPYEKIKLLSKIYPYNSAIFTISVGNAEFNKKRRGDINGYVPLTNVRTEPINDGSTFINYALDSNKIKIYECFIKDCINSNIELYIVCSPLFIKPNYISNSVVAGKKIAAKYNVRFFDFSKDSAILNSPNMFADIGHLNNRGAEVFSNRVMDSMATPSKNLSIIKTLFIKPGHGSAP